MAPVNTWVTAVFVGLMVIFQLMGIMLGGRWRLDGWGLLTGFMVGTIFYVLTRDLWFSIAIQLVGG